MAAVDADRAVELIRQAQADLAEAAALLGALHGTGLAQWTGYTTLARMVAHRSACGNQLGADLVRVGRHLEAFPATAAAVASGRINWAAAEVLARTANGLRRAYERDEAELLELADSIEVEDLVRRCRRWRARADSKANADDSERIFRQRGVHAQFAFDGSCRGRFTLDPTGAESVWAALETRPDPADTLPEPRTTAQRRADQLVGICQDFLGTSATPGTAGPDTDTAHPDTDADDRTDGNTDGSADRQQAWDLHGGGTRAMVDVIIDIETLAGVDGPVDRLRAELAHGAPITGPGLDRLLCDASFRALLTDGPGVVLAYNRATPDIPPALRRAVRLRDQRCTFAGCDRPWNWCDLHHLVPRNRGGPTTADNLTLLCRFHHTCVHEGGWQLSRSPDGSIITRSP